MTLRRRDGRVYLDRWGWEFPRRRNGENRTLFGIFLHRFEGPDPGRELHDHPWWFVTLILKGGYQEERAPIREAPRLARAAVGVEGRLRVYAPYGTEKIRRVGRLYLMRLGECHRITELLGRGCTWSLVIHGPYRRQWGFYLPSGWVDKVEYEHRPEGKRREMTW